MNVFLTQRKLKTVGNWIIFAQASSRSVKKEGEEEVEIGDRKTTKPATWTEQALYTSRRQRS